MTTQEERTWGLLSHLIPLVLALTTSFGWIAALVVWLAFKDKSRFVAFHALQQLLLMGVLWLASLVAVVFFFTIVGIPVAILVWAGCLVAGIVLPILGMVRANAGEWYEFPVVGRIARKAV